MNFTTATIAEQRRNDMITSASQRSLARTARAAHKAERPAGRLQSLVASLFSNVAANESAPVETTAAMV